MSDSFFDSNIFVYLWDNRDPEKYRVAANLVRSALEDQDVIISSQVVQETLNVVTRKLPGRMLARDATIFLAQVLMPLWKVMPTEDLFRRALDIQERYQCHFHDALIVAAALASGCSRLYSEDLQDGQRISGLTIINPFLD